MNVSKSKPEVTRFSRLLIKPKRKLPIPSTSRTHEEGCQRSANILLGNVGLKSEACPVQTDAEVTVAIEIVTSLEHMKSSDRMHHDEEEQKHGTSSPSRSVVGNLTSQRQDLLRLDLHIPWAWRQQVSP